MKQIDKNTVSSKDQLKQNDYINFIHESGTGMRVLFVGNSITRHGIAPQIGWNNDWGMAASDIQKDYVHLLVTKISSIDPQASFCIAQVAEWERNYKNGSDTLQLYEDARNFDADIIIMRCIENCPGAEFEPDVFNKEYTALIDYFNPNNKAKVILSTGFWKHIGDEEIINVSIKRNYPLAVLGDLGEDDSMKAVGLFAHDGVANHPSDKGMSHIADRIFEFIKK